MIRRVLHNTLTQFVGKLASATISFCTTLILARSLGSHFFGEYTKIIGFTTLFYLFVDFGLNTIFLKEARQQQSELQKKLPKLLGLRIFLGGLCVVLALVLAGIGFLFNPGFNLLVVIGVAIYSLSIVGYGIFVSAGAIFQSKLRYGQAVLALNIGAIVSLVLLGPIALGWIDPKAGVLLAVTALSLGMAVSAGFSLFFVRRSLIAIQPQFDAVFWKRLLRRSWPLGLVLICNVLYFRADILVLSYFRTSAEIGSYGLAYKFFEFVITIPTFIMNSAYPLLIESPRNQQGYALRKIMILLLLLAPVMVVGLWFSSPLLVRIRPDFGQAVVFLQLLSLSLPIFFLTSPLMWLFVLRDKQRQLIWVYASALVLNVVGNIVFVPKFGAHASAVLTGLGELWVLLGGGWLWYKKRGVV